MHYIKYDVRIDKYKNFLIHISASRYPKQQGVFAHAADVRNGNTLLVVGGYHGNVNADLLAYTLPPMLASREGEPYEPDQVCGR